MAPAPTNWAGHHVYAAERFHEPSSVDEIREIVDRSSAVHAVGSRHSFNDVADTDGELVSLRSLPRVFELDPDARTVTIDGGMTYAALCPMLDAAGFALHNLASLPHISVVGACATATHGSGSRHGNLATAVRAIEIVTADGEMRRFARGDRGFEGVVVSLGLLGVVIRLTLDVEPAYEMRQDVYLDLPFGGVTGQLDALMAATDSVSLFTTWREPVIEQLWFKSRELGTAPAIPSARPATTNLHPIASLPAGACTGQLGDPGPWFARLPHFRIGHTPSAGNELQSEYLVPSARAAAALGALERIRERFSALVLVSEIRTVAADTQWLSTAEGRDSTAIHFTWVKDWPSVRAVLPEIETALEPFEPRPHWGKLFAMPAASVRARYAHFEDFTGLREELDPTGVFDGPFARRLM